MKIVGIYAMVTILLISLIIILYLCIRYLYIEYRKEVLDNDFISLQNEVRLSKLERKESMNEQMINWLWEQVAKEKFKEQKSKERKGNK